MPESDKVIAIFRELVGERALKLDGSRFPADAMDRITEALTQPGEDPVAKDRISHHLMEWQRSAAFLVALALFPERFTDEEIQDEVEDFFLDVPAHVLEAARVAGCPAKNIFHDKDEETSG
jgi:hypothetical protein